MISGGDELGRTQLGNNNTYCQDNALSWFQWSLSPAQEDLLEFTKYMIRLWKEQPVLQRRKFFQGRSIRGAGVKDIAWFEPSGREMDDDAWNAHFVRSLGVRLNGEEMEEVDEEGDPVVGATLFLMFNAHHGAIPFALPPSPWPKERWERLLDTAEEKLRWKQPHVLRDHRYRLRGRSVAVFRLKNPRAIS